MFLRSLGLVLLSATLTACNITGSSQKGPFKEGSKISTSQLDAQGSPIVSTTIETDVFGSQGKFSVDRITWSGWTGLEVTGQYFNELSNSASEDVLSLNAITRKDRRFDTANINLFTHLAAARIRQQISTGKNRNRAWRDTQTELKQLFGLKRVSRNHSRGVEHLDLLNGSNHFRNDNANLLLFTGAFLATDGNATSLQALTDDFADDGEFNGDGQTSFAAIAVAANTPDLLETLSQNLSANGANNPPNQQDLQQLPTWVNTDVEAPDTEIPVITIGNVNVSLVQGIEFTDDVSASDNKDGDITANIVTTGTVDINTVDTYTLTYTVSDAAGNTAEEVTRIVEITEIPDITAPVITIGSTEVSLNQGETFVDDVTASDDKDGDITENVVITGIVDTAIAGIYTLTYNVSDIATNAALTVTRNVTINDVTAPVITVGSTEISLDQGETFVEDVTASDDKDGDITENVVITGIVDNAIAGIYTLTYNVSDIATNAALTVTRSVTINDVTAPVITVGSTEISLDQGEIFVEDVTASDDKDGDVTENIVITGSVNTTTAGVYTLTYNVSDIATNVAQTVTRTVTVNDITLPIISIGNSEINLEQGTRFLEDVSASDDTDGDITRSVIITGTFNTDIVGSYSLTYDVTDAAGNEATSVTRTVEVTAIPSELSSVNVRVTSPAGDVLEGVTVVAISSDNEELSFTTDSDGIGFLELPANEDHVLNFDLEGYATQVSPVKAPSVSNSIDVDIMMILRGSEQVFTQNSDNLIGADGASVSVEAGSFIDASGNPVTDSITLTMTPVDISTSAGIASFPGEFSGIADGDITDTPIASYGTVEYHFTLTSTGEELQLAPGETAEISIPMYELQRQDGSGNYQVGDEIALWSLNEDTGIWEQEGTGIVTSSEASPTGFALVATVTHFTWWNCDVTMNPAEVEISINGVAGSGTALIKAQTNGNIGGFRPNTVDTVVNIGATSGSLPFPSNGTTCFWAEITNVIGSTSSTSQQCISGDPGVNYTLIFDTVISEPLLVGSSPLQADPFTSEITISLRKFEVMSLLTLQSLTTETNVSYSITNGSLPSGITLNQFGNTKAIISGAPDSEGNGLVSITATDSDLNTQVIVLNFEVAGEIIGIDFLKTIGTDRSESYQAVTTDSFGDIYAVGEIGSQFASTIQPFENAAITKLSSSGEVIWTKTLLSSTEAFQSVKIDSNGYIYAVGSTRGTYSSSSDALIVKYDADGNLLWERNFGGSASDFFTDFDFDSSGNIFSVGSTRSNDGDITDGNTGYSDTLLVKFSPDGTIIWDKTIGSTSYDRFNTIVIDGNDNIYAAGTAQTIDGDFSGVELGYTDIIVVKLDTDGVMLWDKVYGAVNGSAGVNDMTQSLDGNLILVGYINNSVILKMDLEGNVIWQTNYSGENDNVYKSVIVDSLGNINIAGTTAFPCLDECYEDYYGSNSGLISVFDSSGTLTNSQDFGGTSYDYLYGITSVADGSVIAVGSTSSSDGDILVQNGKGDSLIIKTTPN